MRFIVAFVIVFMASLQKQVSAQEKDTLVEIKAIDELRILP